MKLLHDNKLQTNIPFEGCTEAELSLLESEIGNKLPFAYQEFLLAAGHNHGKLFQGSDIEFSQLRDLQIEARELVRENNYPIILLENAFIFSMHQGYEIRFFELNGNDKSPVLEWYEGSDKGIVMLSESFEDFLQTQIEQHSHVKLKISSVLDE